MSRLHVGLAVVLLCGLVQPARADRAAPLSEEARVLARVRAAWKVADLAQLTSVREHLGKIHLAIATWETLKRLHGAGRYTDGLRTPPYSCATVAHFNLERLRRKLRFAAHPPLPLSAKLRARMGWDATQVDERFMAGRKGLITLVMQLDMDGDLVDEVFVVGKFQDGDKHDEPFMFLARWTGAKYEVVWRAMQADLGGAFPLVFEAVDIAGDGCKNVIGIFATGGLDGAMFLQWNGGQALAW
jgi:hypothetical protein